MTNVMETIKNNVKVTALKNVTMNLPEVHMALGRSTVRLVTRPEGDDPRTVQTQTSCKPRAPSRLSQACWSTS